MMLWTALHAAASFELVDSWRLAMEAIVTIGSGYREVGFSSARC